MAAAEYQREVRALRHELTQRIAALQRLAGATRLKHRVWVHQQAVPRGRHRDRQQAIGRAQREAAQQQRTHVVTVAATAGHCFAIQRKRVKRLARQRRIQQCVGRHQRRHARCRRSAHARAERNALVDLDGETEVQSEPCAQRHQRSSGGIAGRFQRQLDRTAPDRLDAYHRLIDAAHAHSIANPGDGMTKNVEAHRHVGHRRRRKRTCDHRRAPSPAATRSRSANTPAAVTSGPAPGPCTTNGLSQ